MLAITQPYQKMAAPLNNTWNKQAIGWFAVEKIPKSLLFSCTEDSRVDMEDEANGDFASLLVAVLFNFSLSAPMLMLKSSPSS